MFLLFLAEQLSRNNQTLNFAGALADGAKFYVTVKLFCGIVLDEAVAAVNLHAFVGDADGHLTGKQLGHAGFAGEADISPVGQPCGLVNQQARGLDLHGHVREFELDGLKLADGLAELLALFGITRRGFQRALGHAEGESGDGDAAAIENFQAAGKSFSQGAKELVRADAAIGEEDFRGVTGAHAKLVFLFAGPKAGSALFQDERADAVRIP